jgi:hypothetical protein
MTWSNVSPGAYALTARADSYTLSATSSVVNITVHAPPAVSITSPANNSLLPPPSIVVPVGINATASDDYGMTQVQIFQGTNCLGTLTNAPYSLFWTNLTSGTYSITAQALAGDGFSATSLPITVTVDTDSNGDGIGDLQALLYGISTNTPVGFQIWIGTPAGKSGLP